jgi:hypothetical protein
MQASGSACRQFEITIFGSGIEALMQGQIENTQNHQLNALNIFDWPRFFLSYTEDIS